MSDATVYEARRRLYELEARFRSYDGGGRPMSPPVSLMRDISSAEEALRIARAAVASAKTISVSPFVVQRFACPTCGSPEETPCDSVDTPAVVGLAQVHRARSDAHAAWCEAKR
jgi:hypothetical protein